MRWPVSLALAVLLVGSACSDDDSAAPATTPPPRPIEGDDTPLVDLEDGRFDIGSPAWGDGGLIPVVHTCDGDDLSPPLAWHEIPATADTLELVVEDPDAPRRTFLHWRVTEIAAGTDGVAMGEVPAGGAEQPNDFGDTGWKGPCPPADDDAHRYLFRLTARDATGEEVGRAEFVGRYGR